MIRFFCTICKKVKRARKYPSTVTNTHDIDVMARVGTCRFHSLPRTQSVNTRETQADFNLNRRVR